MAGLFATLVGLFSSCSAGPEKPKTPKPKPIAEGLLWISWSSGGGMNGGRYENKIENENGKYQVIIHDQPTHDAKPKITTVKVTKNDLDALFKHIEKNYTYKKWDSFPRSELIALDAPTSHVSIALRNKEGRLVTYGVSDTKKFPKGQSAVLYDVRQFIQSYAAKNPQTFSIVRTGFDGNPQAEHLEIDNPGMVRYSADKKYRDPNYLNSAKTGGRFDIKYVFYGRIPGETKMRFTAQNMVKPIEYKVVVDKEFNLTVEKL
ncbi:MAG: hypothetical protein Q4D21_04945 [Phascolarctobacterium sp.]|nr:hypothetical protein [Phascolarctobacterium sp.]